MAVLMSARWPSNSRQTTPISSVTLAWRTLVTTLNLWPNSQTTGVVISFGGYISHRRVFWGWVWGVGAADGLFFLTLGGMRCGVLRTARSAAGDGRDDADFVAVFDRRLLIFQETDVLLVHVNVHEPPHRPSLIEQTLLDAWIARLQLG